MGGPAFACWMHRSPASRSVQDAAGRAPRRTCGDAPCLRRVGPLLRLCRQWRQSPIRRIQDQRRAPSPNDRGTPVQPEIVVKTGCSVLPPVHVAIGRRSLGSASQQTCISVKGLLFEAQCLFLCQKLSARQLFWPLEGRDGAIVPHALQVRLTPRRSRGTRRLSSSGHWHQRHDRDHRTHRSGTSMAHPCFLLALSAFVRVHPSWTRMRRRARTRRSGVRT